jgi:dCMP deaminase
MLNSTLYLVCIDAETDELVPDTNSCSMCKRLIINAGIETVIVRDTATEYRVFNVQKDWVENDGSLTYNSGY